jgi:hypothetical protein
VFKYYVIYNLTVMRITTSNDGLKHRLGTRLEYNKSSGGIRSGWEIVNGCELVRLCLGNEYTHVLTPKLGRIRASYFFKRSARARKKCARSLSFAMERRLGFSTPTHKTCAPMHVSTIANDDTYLVHVIGGLCVGEGGAEKELHLLSVCPREKPSRYSRTRRLSPQ